MTGKSPTPECKIIAFDPQTGAAIREIPKRPAADTTPVNSGNAQPVDHRFSSWISSMAVATGVATGVSQIVGGAEAFLEMFGPINS